MSDYAARFVSDLVGNPEDRFSDVAAHFTNDLNLAQRPCIARGNKVFRYSHDHTGMSTF